MSHPRLRADHFATPYSPIATSPLICPPSTVPTNSYPMAVPWIACLLRNRTSFPLVDPRTSPLPQQVLHLFARDAERRTVPLDAQLRSVVRKVRGLDDLSGHARNRLDPLADRIQPRLPHLPLRVVVALGPDLDRCQHAHDLFF